MELLRRFGYIFDRVMDALSIFACVLLAFVMIIVCAEIVFRYFLGSPIIWVVEISEVTLLYITFLGAAWLLRREGHVKIELLLSRLTPRTESWFNFAISIAGAVMCAILVWYSAQQTWVLFERNVLTPTVLELPKGPIVLIIPIGSFLLVIQFLKRAWGYRRGIAPSEKAEISL